MSYPHSHGFPKFYLCVWVVVGLRMQPFGRVGDESVTFVGDW